MEDSIERRALVLLAVAAFVISFGASLGLVYIGDGASGSQTYAYIGSLVALMVTLVLSALIVAPLGERTLAWSRESILRWAILLFVVGIGLLALDLAVAAHNFSTGYDEYG